MILFNFVSMVLIIYLTFILIGTITLLFLPVDKDFFVISNRTLYGSVNVLIKNNKKEKDHL